MAEETRSRRIMENQSESENEERASLEKIRFPPPALWYNANAARGRDDMWAYLALNQIVLVRPKETYPKVAANVNGSGSEWKEGHGLGQKSKSSWPTFEVFGYSSEGYNCLSFCQSSWDFLPVKCSPLVTGCREGFVRIWNVLTGECVMYHDVHKDEKRISVTCIDWCAKNPKVIYSMDEEGTLVSWYLPKGLLKSFSFGKITPSSLHCSPHEDNILCFGTKGGVIFIVKTDPSGKGSVNVLKKVRHDYDGEVVATLWCPQLDWSMKDASTTGQTQVFASSVNSNKLPVVRLWGKNAEDRGMYKVGEKNPTAKLNQKYFSPLLWAIDPNSGDPMLLTAKKNNIVSYTKGMCEVNEVIHENHQTSSIFALVQCGDILWSTCYEPVIIGWNLRTNRISCIIPTFKGVCSILPSPTVGTLIGMGGVDGFIRTIDFVRNFPRYPSARPPAVSYKLRCKILSLAWHPIRDNWLAFGTDDGIIGIFELQENQRHLRQFERHIRGAVYSLDWGPMVSSKSKMSQLQIESGEEAVSSSSKADKKGNWYLYACGGYGVFTIDPSSRSNPLVNVLQIIETTNPPNVRSDLGDSDDSDLDASSAPKPKMISKAVDIRWSPDHAYLAVGYNDGRVELYSPPFLQLKCWIKCHVRGIQNLSWRTYDFLPNRPKHHEERWLATCGNDGSCKLFDLGRIFEEKFYASEEEKPIFIISSAATLASPKGERIISSCWSPHNPDLICTVSYDSTAIVWNKKDGTPISRYFGHLHRLVACAFHPVNEFEIVSASDELMYDCSVHLWDYRDHPFVEKLMRNEKLLEKVQPLHVKGKEQVSKENKDDEDSNFEDGIKTSKKDLSSHLHVLDQSAINSKLVSTQIAATSSSSGAKKKKGSKGSKSLLTSSANEFTNTKLDLETEVRYIVEQLIEKQKKSEANEGNDINGKSDEGGDADGSGSDGSEKSMVYLGILGDYDHCVELLKRECETHAQKKDWEKGCFLATWMGWEEFIVRAAEAGEASETLLLLSHGKLSKPPHCKKMCLNLAEKFVSEEEIAKAATFFFMAGMKEKAVEVLAEHKLYRDAVALFKVSILKNPKFHVEVMKQWLVSLVEGGNFETACKVYASLKMYDDALKIIERRDTEYAWRVGMYLAKKCGNTKKVELFGLRLFTHCISKYNHETAKKMVSDYENELQWLQPLVLVHENVFHLSNRFRDMKITDPAQDAFSKDEFKSKLVAFLDLKDEKRSVLIRKLKETLLISVAQNLNDAEIILIRSIALLLLEDCEVKNSKDDLMKLCATWLKERNLPLYSAYLFALNDF